MIYIRLLSLTLLFTLTAYAGGTYSPVADRVSEIIRHPDPAAPLAQRWSWAIERGGARSEAFWVGYTIRRMMPEGATMYIGSWSSNHDNAEGSLADLLAGRTAPPGDDADLQEAAQRALNQRDEQNKKRVWRDVAVLIHYPAGATSAESFQKIIMGNLEAPFSLDNDPLFWLGAAADDESLDLLEARYREASDIRSKKRLVAIYGMHGAPDRVVPWLGDILNSNEDEDLRASTTLWLGSQNDDRAITLLERAARDDRSAEVRKDAVFGLSQAERPRAVEVMIDLVRTADDREVRESAVFWLGQQASPKAAAAIESFIYDKDVEIQKKAVFALAQLDTGGSVERLITVAKTHPRQQTRKEAIFWISQVASEKAADALGTFAREDEDTEVQKQAVFALSQLDDGAGVPDLIDISNTHPNAKVRKSAIFWLGQSGDPRALEALEALVTGQ